MPVRIGRNLRHPIVAVNDLAARDQRASHSYDTVTAISGTVLSQLKHGRHAIASVLARETSATPGKIYRSMWFSYVRLFTSKEKLRDLRAVRKVDPSAPVGKDVYATWFM